MLQDRLMSLRREIIEYAGLVEDMIDKSVRGLLTKDPGLLREVIESDEPRANEKEILIDEMSTTTIAQFQPKAKDLRIVLMTLQMSNDLERVGDHAVNVAENALFLIERPPVKPLIDIPRMAETTLTMLRDSITAFINEDVALALSVCEADQVVDALGNQILRELITYMSAEPATIERSLRLLLISRNMERIADLSTNVCEDVIFLVEGRVIKHRYTTP